MNYFEFYNIPISFKVDKSALKKIFYSNSKKYHPDYFTLESEEKQAEILELSTLNNKAYQTLKDFDKRLKYILDLKNILGEEGQNKLSQMFLMEMMELNEALMEMQFDFEEKRFKEIVEMIDNQENAIYSDVQVILESYLDETNSEEDLLKIKDYYLKKKYLIRLRENLEKMK